MNKQGTFTQVRNVDKIVSAEYDTTSHLIYSCQSQGCADMAMAFGVYRIVMDTVQQVKFVYCGCCDGNSCQIDVDDKKHYTVPQKEVYLHVPRFFSKDVKEKCEM